MYRLKIYILSTKNHREDRNLETVEGSSNGDSQYMQLLLQAVVQMNTKMIDIEKKLDLMERRTEKIDSLDKKLDLIMNKISIEL